MNHSISVYNAHSNINCMKPLQSSDHKSSYLGMYKNSKFTVQQNCLHKRFWNYTFWLSYMVAINGEDKKEMLSLAKCVALTNNFWATISLSYRYRPIAETFRFFDRTVKPVLVVTSIKQPTCIKQPEESCPKIHRHIFELYYAATCFQQPHFKFPMGGCLRQGWLYFP